MLYVKQVIVKAPADGAEILKLSQPPLPANPPPSPEYALAHKMTESSSVNGMFELEAMEYERETKIFMRGRSRNKVACYLLRTCRTDPKSRASIDCALLCELSGRGVLGST